MASLGMIEFHVEVEGKGPDTTEPDHTIYSQSGVSAAEKGFYLAQGLTDWARAVAEEDRYRHTGLEQQAGQSFALLVGSFVSGSENQAYEIPTRCQFKGAVNFPPGADLEQVQQELENAFGRLVRSDDWLNESHARFEWGDAIAESCQSDEGSKFLRVAQAVIREVTGRTPRYNYGHSASDIRYPMLWWNAAGLGIGPLAGDMGTPTEYVDRREYLDTIIVFVELLRRIA
jgi:acetylornithine deacetylase/succinyl-diaminopimelate desuccinylase-like protein